MRQSSPSGRGRQCQGATRSSASPIRTASRWRQVSFIVGPPAVAANRIRRREVTSRLSPGCHEGLTGPLAIGHGVVGQLANRGTAKWPRANWPRVPRPIGHSGGAGSGTPPVACRHGPRDRGTAGGGGGGVGGPRARGGEGAGGGGRPGGDLRARPGAPRTRRSRSSARGPWRSRPTSRTRSGRAASWRRRPSAWAGRSTSWSPTPGGRRRAPSRRPSSTPTGTPWSSTASRRSRCAGPPSRGCASAAGGGWWRSPRSARASRLGASSPRRPRAPRSRPS